MSEFVRVAKASELSEGAMKEVEAQGREFLLAKVGGKYYAANAFCPHMGGRLAQGKLNGLVVTCPRHGSRFELSDGHVVRWLKGSGLLFAIGKALKHPRPLDVYEAKVEGDSIMLKI